jgi:hypothetical protein
MARANFAVVSEGSHLTNIRRSWRFSDEHGADVGAPRESRKGRDSRCAALTGSQWTVLCGCARRASASVLEPRSGDHYQSRRKNEFRDHHPPHHQRPDTRVLGLAATDAPFLRPSNLAFTIEVHTVVVEVPFVD